METSFGHGFFIFRTYQNDPISPEVDFRYFSKKLQIFTFKLILQEAQILFKK
eukprot:UN00758